MGKKVGGRVVIKNVQVEKSETADTRIGKDLPGLVALLLPISYGSLETFTATYNLIDMLLHLRSRDLAIIF